MFGVIFLVSQFLQSVMGYTPLGAGVHGLPWTAAPAVTAPIAGLLSDRIGGRRIVAIGVALQAIGIGWLAAEITATVPYTDLIAPFLIAGTGLGFFFAPITRLTLGYAPGQLEGIASGTSNALRQVGTVLGVAVLGSVFSAAGALGSPGQFTTGLRAALTVSAVILAASALVVLLAPEIRPRRGRRQRQRQRQPGGGRVGADGDRERPPRARDAAENQLAADAGLGEGGWPWVRSCGTARWPRSTTRPTGPSSSRPCSIPWSTCWPGWPGSARCSSSPSVPDGWRCR
jgi:MFS family permease